MRDARADHDGAPFTAGHVHLLFPQHLDDHRVPLGSEVARELVALADLEGHRANPVQEGRVVQRIGHGRCGGVGTRFAIEARIGEDLELARPVLALLVGLVPVAPGLEIVSSDPRLKGLVEVIPQRAAADVEHEVDRLRAAQRIDPRHFHRRAPYAEGAEPGAVHQALPNGERDRGPGERCGGGGDGPDRRRRVVTDRVGPGRIPAPLRPQDGGEEQQRGA